MSSFQCLFWLTVGNKYSNWSMKVSLPVLFHTNFHIQFKRGKGRKKKKKICMILDLDLWRDCVMRERMMITFGSSKGSELRAWNGKVCWLYVVGVVCLYVHLCLYVYTSCLFTYFFLTQIMKGKANWLCRTYWLIFRSRFTPKKISKKVSTSQVTVLDSVKKGRLDQLISSLISTFFL